MSVKLKLVLVLGLSLVWLTMPRTVVFAATSVSQFGITWTFDGDYQTGQFANRDWWVVGPVTITAIDPAPSGGRNGTVANPRFASEQGYDTRAVAYNASLSKVPPFTANPGDSILSSISLAELTSKSYISLIAVLTVVDVPQAPDKFRPPYTRPAREPVSSQDELIFSTDDIRWELLSQLEPISSTPALSETERKFEKFRMEHYKGWQRSEITPIDSASTYGREVSGAVSEASLQLNLNYTDEEKRTLMFGLLQFGIDLYGVYLDNGEWHSDGGIFCGRKWPLLFAGIMLDNEIKNIDMPPERFHEDGQTFYVSRHPDGDSAPPGNEDYDIYTPPYGLKQYGWSGNNYETGTVKITHGSKIVEGVGTAWAGSDKVAADYSFGVRNDIEAYKIDGRAYWIESIIDDTHMSLTESYRGETDTSGNATYKINPRLITYGHGNGGKVIDYIEYTAEHEGLPEWGITHDRATSFDGLNWGAPYRLCCNARAWAGFVLTALIMEEKAQAKTLWNHDALFDFQDRYMAVELVAHGKGHWMRRYSFFIEDMWDTYRTDYGSVWSGELFYVIAPEQPEQPEPEPDIIPEDSQIPEVTALQVRNNILKTGGNQSALIRCDMKEAGNLSVKIYDAKGKEIITIFNGHKDAGRHEFSWSGTDSGNSKVGSGIYMVHMKIGSYKETKKIAVVK